MCIRDFYHSKDTRWRVLTAHLSHLYFGDGFGLWEIVVAGFSSIHCFHNKARVEQLFGHLAAFNNEETKFFAELLQAERGDLFYFVFGNHKSKKAASRMGQPKKV